MANFNQVQIMGYVGNKPEIAVLPNGDLVANFSVATSKSWIDKNTNEKREKVSWHRIVFFRKQAEIVEKYIDKGSLIFVQGELNYREWEDKNKSKHITAEIYGNNLKLLSKKETNTIEISTDEIPF